MRPFLKLRKPTTARHTCCTELQRQLHTISDTTTTTTDSLNTTSQSHGLNNTPSPHISKQNDEFYMRMALQEAQIAADAGEIPVGAIIVDPAGVIIAKSHNKTEQAKDPTAHAEMLCLREASQVCGGWRLQDMTMYVTLEPCGMCAGALLQSRVKEVVYGARNSLLGADGSWIDMLNSGSYEEEEEEEVELEYSDKSSRSRSNTIGSGAIREDHQGLLDTDGDGTVFYDTYTSNNDSIHSMDDDDKRERQYRPVRPVRPHPFHPHITVRRGILADECSDIMKNFFQIRRQQEQ